MGYTNMRTRQEIKKSGPNMQESTGLLHIIFEMELVEINWMGLQRGNNQKAPRREPSFLLFNLRIFNFVDA